MTRLSHYLIPLRNIGKGRLLLLALVLLSAPLRSVHANEGAPAVFPRPKALEANVQFWIRIYTQVDTRAGLLHDDTYLNIVYTQLNFPDDVTRPERDRHVKKAKDKYSKILHKLAAGERQQLSQEEKRILSLWPAEVSAEELRAAAERLRFQLGQADKFLAGLQRAGYWQTAILEILQQEQVPQELVALPHVESSYNPRAYSHRGAAGLWQFTQPTGKQYLRINRALDERMDPLKATYAAARLLKDNLSLTGNWPLAITAYNHGAAGMRRAIQETGSDDIATIAWQYRGPSFGFASRNFYTSFLAALEVSQHANHYFGHYELHPPQKLDVVTLDDYFHAETLAQHLGISMDILAEYNLALRSAVWQGLKLIPRGYELQIPSSLLPEPAHKLLAAIPSEKRHQLQLQETEYTVRRGDTLSAIAARFDVSLKQLLTVNDLSSRDLLRIGQVIQLPVSAPRSKLAHHNSQPKAIEKDHYIVRAGDSLSTIAKRFSLSEATLLTLNQLTDPNRIYVGQRLSIDSAKLIRVAQPEPTLDEATFQAVVLTNNDDSPDATTPSSSTNTHDSAINETISIEVQAPETLGHYADWLQVPIQKLRLLNKLATHEPVVIGQKLHLDFSRVSQEIFEQRRQTFHAALQQDFFSRYRVIGSIDHVVSNGESLWTLTQQKYSVPAWLLRQYNPSVDFNLLRPGMQLKIPELDALTIAETDSEAG